MMRNPLLPAVERFLQLAWAGAQRQALARAALGFGHRGAVGTASPLLAAEEPQEAPPEPAGLTLESRVPTPRQEPVAPAAALSTVTSLAQARELRTARYRLFLTQGQRPDAAVAAAVDVPSAPRLPAAEAIDPAVAAWFAPVQTKLAKPGMPLPVPELQGAAARHTVPAHGARSERVTSVLWAEQAAHGRLPAAVPGASDATIAALPTAASEPQPFRSESQISPSESQVSTSGRQVSARGRQVSVSESQVSVSESQVLASGSQVLASGSQVLASERQVLASERQVLASERQVLASGRQVLASGSQVLASERQVSASESQVLPSESQVLPSESQVSASESQVPAIEFQGSASGLPVFRNNLHAPTAADQAVPVTARAAYPVMHSGAPSSAVWHPAVHPLLQSGSTAPAELVLTQAAFQPQGPTPVTSAQLRALIAEILLTDGLRHGLIMKEG